MNRTTPTAAGRLLPLPAVAGVALLATLLAPAGAAAVEADPLAALDFLVGSWRGEIDGNLGTGTGSRVYERVAADRYLMMRHSSSRPPQPKSPKGDAHEEVAIFSWDRTGDRLVLRQFAGEGFVNRYGCEEHGAPAVGYVCVTESVESGPGVRARATLTKISDDAFEERFELGWPGEELQLLFTNRWFRKDDVEASLSGCPGADDGG